MKARYLIVATALTLWLGTAYGGLALEAPVMVDLENGTATGNMASARFSDNDVEYIGCGTRQIDLGSGITFEFGFCQAQDLDDNYVLCVTQNPLLIDEMRAMTDFSYVTFSFAESPDAPGAYDCNQIGFSTQSFYIPGKVVKFKKKWHKHQKID